MLSYLLFLSAVLEINALFPYDKWLRYRQGMAELYAWDTAQQGSYPDELVRPIFPECLRSVFEAVIICITAFASFRTAAIYLVPVLFMAMFLNRLKDNRIIAVLDHFACAALFSVAGYVMA